MLNQLPPPEPVVREKPLEAAEIMLCRRLLICIKIKKFWCFFISFPEGFIE